MTCSECVTTGGLTYFCELCEAEYNTKQRIYREKFGNGIEPEDY